MDFPQGALQLRLFLFQRSPFLLHRCHTLPEEGEVVLSQLQQLIQPVLLPVGACQLVLHRGQGGLQHVGVPAGDVLGLVHGQLVQGVLQVVQDLVLHQAKLGGGAAAGPHTQQVGFLFHHHALHVLPAVDALHQPGQGAAHRAVVLGRLIAAIHDGLDLVKELPVHDGRVEAVSDGPLIPGLIDGDVLWIPLGPLPDVFFLVPDDLAHIGGVAKNLGHAVAGELRGAVGPGAQGIDMPGHGHAAIPLGVQFKHHAYKLCFRFVDLQGGLAVYYGLVVAVGGIGHVTTLLDGHLEPSAKTLGYDFVLPAGDEGFQLGVLLVDLVGEVVNLFRGDDESSGLPEGVQDDALVLHAATGEPVQVHAQHRVVVSILHVLQEPEHLGAGIERLAADHLGVLGQDVNAVGGGVVIEGLLVFG